MARAQRKKRTDSSTANPSADKSTPAASKHNQSNRDKSGKGILAINAKITEPQTLVQLCRNQTQYLSPTGWTDEAKSTLLDSRYLAPPKNDKTSEGQTQFTLPASAAAALTNGDRLNLYIPSLGLSSDMIWSANHDMSPDEILVTSKLSAAPLKPATKEVEPALDTPRSIENADKETTGAITAGASLLKRFRPQALVPKQKSTQPITTTPEKAAIPEVENQLSDMRKRAEEARRAADALEREMKLAHQAKQKADARVAEAAKLAEIASLAEHEQAKQVANAQKALRRAERERKAEEARIETERLAAQKRAEQDAILAETARKKALKIALEQKRDLTVQSLTTTIAQQKTKIVEHKKLVANLRAKTKETDAQIKVGEQNFSNAQAEADRARDLTQNYRLKIQTTQTAVSDLEKSQHVFESELKGRQKKADKAAREIEKLKNAHLNAQQVAQAALDKAKVLQANVSQAEQDFHILQADHTKFTRSYSAASQEIAQQKNQLERQQSLLTKADQELTDHRSILSTIQSKQKNIDGESAQTMHRLTQRKNELASIETSQKELGSKLSMLNRLSISTDNLDAIDAALSANHNSNFAAYDPTVSQQTINDQALIEKPVSKKKERAFALSNESQQGVLVADNAPSALAAPSVLAAMATANGAAKALPKLPFNLPTSLSRIAMRPHRNLLGILLLGAAAVGTMYFISQPSNNVKIAIPKTAKPVPVKAAETPIKSVVIAAPIPVIATPLEIVTAEMKTPPVEQQAVITSPLPEPMKQPFVAFDLPVFRDALSPPSSQASQAEAWETLSRPIEVMPTISIKKPALKIKVAKVKAKPKLEIKPREAVKTTAPKIATAPNPTVQATQTKLKKLSFYSGTATGFIDPSTRQAIADFQSLFDISPTGTLTAQTLSELRQADIQVQSVQTIAPPVNDVVTQSQIAPLPLTVSPTDASLTTRGIANVAPTVITNVVLDTPTPVSNSPKVSETAAVSDTIVAAEKLNAVRPSYPDRAARSRHNKQATIIVNYTVDTNGKTTDLSINSSTGTGRFSRDFERSALSAIKKLRFSPKTKNGTPIKSGQRQTKLRYNPPQ